jgi:uncharacterized protein
VRDAAIYLDSSAIIKLLFEEDESDALREFLVGHPRRVSSVVARLEVLRTIGRVEDAAVTREANELLDRIHLIRPDDTMLTVAAEVGPATLRTLDAIHLVTALSLRPDLAGVVAYDRVLGDAARAAGLTVFAPA